MKYRELKDNEVIREGDEMTPHQNLDLHSETGWSTTGIGGFNMKVDSNGLRYRRPYEPDPLLNEDEESYGTEFFDGDKDHLAGMWTAYDYKKMYEYSEPESLKKTPRKDMPIYSGLMTYFPDALRAVAHCSKVGNDQHNPGTSLKWDRSKSGDELDALARHLLEAGTKDTDGVRHSTKVAWRALANLQKELEAVAGRKEVETA
jgi:hypothetical protein